MRGLSALSVESRRFWMAAALLMIVQTIALCGAPAWERVPLSPPPHVGEPIGRWSGGAYLAIEGHSSAAPVLLVYNQSGELAQRVTIEVPGARHLLILNGWFARRADGYLAVVGMASDERLGAGFLDIISPGADKQTVVRLFPYGAEAVTFAPNGTIWTAGIENHDEPGTSQEYLILRRFDITGKQTAVPCPVRTSRPDRSRLEGRNWFPPRTGWVGSRLSDNATWSSRRTVRYWPATRYPCRWWTFAGSRYAMTTACGWVSPAPVRKARA